MTDGPYDHAIKYQRVAEERRRRMAEARNLVQTVLSLGEIDNASRLLLREALEVLDSGPWAERPELGLVC